MTDKKSCFFCTPDGYRKKFIYEGKTLLSFLDNFPVSPGHFLIFPKRHIIMLQEMSEKEWSELNIAISETIKSLNKKDLENHYRNSLKFTSNENNIWYFNNILKSPYLKSKITEYNLGLNNGPSAGKTAEHLHWHVIPRFKGDVEDPRGGVRNVIPDLGNYKIKRP